jgi:hypothetical protein
MSMQWTPETCPGIEHIGEHVWGNIRLRARPLTFLGLSCLYCFTPKPPPDGLTIERRHEWRIRRG